MGWGSTFGVFYCSSLILRRYDVCLLRRQCLISYYTLNSGAADRARQRGAVIAFILDQSGVERNV